MSSARNFETDCSHFYFIVNNFRRLIEVRATYLPFLTAESPDRAPLDFHQTRSLVDYGAVEMRARMGEDEATWHTVAHKRYQSCGMPRIRKGLSLCNTA